MKLIGLYGLARSGKNTVADFLAEKDYNERSFAHQLKFAARMIFGFSMTQVFGDEKDDIDGYWGFTPRWALQVLGTDCVRNHIGDDVWIKSFFRHLDITTIDPDTAKYVVSDVRFLNEAEAIREKGGKLWKIVRTDHEGLSGETGTHASETELVNLPDSFWDGVIKAKTGEMDWLRTQAFELLEEK